MNNDRISGIGEFLRPVPNLFYKWTGGIILRHLHAEFVKPVFNLKRSSEGWDNDDVVREDFVPGDELGAIGVHDESNPAVAQVVVHFGVMDHLAEKKNAATWILIERPVTDFDGILHPVTKSEMTGKVKHYRSKIQATGTEVLLPGIP